MNFQIQHVCRGGQLLQHTASHCITLHHTASHCNTLQRTSRYSMSAEAGSCCNASRIRLFTSCSVLQCVAVCCSVLQCVAVCFRMMMLQCVAECSSMLKCITTTHYNTLQHSSQNWNSHHSPTQVSPAKRCNTMQNAATH